MSSLLCKGIHSFSGPKTPVSKLPTSFPLTVKSFFCLPSSILNSVLFVACSLRPDPARGGEGVGGWWEEPSLTMWASVSGTM